MKIIAGVFVTLILILATEKQGKEITALLALFAGCAILIFSLQYLEPVIALTDTLMDMSGLDSQLLQILLKAVGIGLLSEFASLICADSGNASLGKGLQLAGTVMILYISIPLFHALLQLIEDILEGL